MIDRVHERGLKSYDHLHPNDAGYKAMGKSIDLALFNRARKIRL
jgi:lysophospholipase L1-like esterase